MHQYLLKQTDASLHIASSLLNIGLPMQSLSPLNQRRGNRPGHTLLNSLLSAGNNAGAIITAGETTSKRRTVVSYHIMFKIQAVVQGRFWADRGEMQGCRIRPEPPRTSPASRSFHSENVIIEERHLDTSPHWHPRRYVLDFIKAAISADTISTIISAIGERNQTG